MKEWYGFLIAFGWEGDPQRLCQLCAFLVENDVAKWYQLERIRDPGTWSGAEEFDEKELGFLRSIAEAGRKRPRSECGFHSSMLIACLY